MTLTEKENYDKTFFVRFSTTKIRRNIELSKELSPMEHPLSQYRLNVLPIPGNEKTNNWAAFSPSHFPRYCCYNGRKNIKKNLIKLKRKNCQVFLLLPRIYLVVAIILLLLCFCVALLWQKRSYYWILICIGTVFVILCGC